MEFEGAGLAFPGSAWGVQVGAQVGPSAQALCPSASPAVTASCVGKGRTRRRTDAGARVSAPCTAALWTSPPPPAHVDMEAGRLSGALGQPSGIYVWSHVGASVFCSCMDPCWCHVRRQQSSHKKNIATSPTKHASPRSQAGPGALPSRAVVHTARDGQRKARG